MPSISIRSLLAALAFSVGAHPADAQQARFFRISGPAATSINAFNPDGTLVWSNAQGSATYTFQTTTSVPGGTNWVDYVQIPATLGLNTNLLIAFNPPTGMALIPAGAFQMGNSIGDNDITIKSAPAPVHTVTVSAFYMDVNLVSYSQWLTVYKWAITNGYSFFDPGSGKAANHPVQSLGWFDCVKWCNARSEKEGRTPAYYTDAGQTAVYRSGQVDGSSAGVKWNAGYRLPTEAEWEKAARGGLAGQRFPWGNTISQSQANYSGYAAISGGYSYDLGPNGYTAAYADGVSPYTSPVGSFAANGYGLYDMAGNVWQWCWDQYDSNYYNVSPGTDPTGPASGVDHMIRGGGWNNNATYCRTAQRDYIGTGAGSGSGFNYLGFRSVLPLSR